MKIFLNNIRLIILAGVILSFAGCIEEDADLPKVVAGFTHTVDEAGTVTFLNTSSKATRYEWDFGDSQTSTEKDPIKTYVPGTYFVSLTASNVAGASDIFKDTLTIIVKDKISLPITFDNENVDYEVTTFNGASFAIVDNPSVSGTNNKVTKVGALTNSGAAFEGMFMDLATQIDLATQKTISMNVLSTSAVPLLLKLEEGTSAPVEVTVNHGGTGWENLKFNFTSSAKYSRLTLFVDGPGTTAGTFHIDDIIQTATIIVFDDGLLTNGDFQNGAASWLAGVGTTPAPVVTMSGNTYYSVNVTSPDPGQPFLINLSQKLPLTSGKSYRLTFDAWSDRNRTIIGGIGRSGGDFANVNQTFNITATRATYTATFNNIGFGEADNRVLFDNNGAAGLVNIDNVSLFEVTGNAKPVISLNGNAVINLIEGAAFTDPGATANDDVDGNITANIVISGDVVSNGVVGTYVIRYNVSDAAGNAATEVTRTVNVTAFDDGLLTNGSFQAGASPWLAGVGTTPAPVITMSGNTYYSVDITSPDPGAPFLVNLSQKLSLTAGQTYTLTFDAWSDRSRTIIGGIGRSEGDFANASQTFNITATRATYTATFTNIGFGEANNRVLFDNNGQVGLVNIDNVKLVLGSGGGGSTNGCTGTLVAAPSLPLNFEGCATFLASQNFGSGLTSELAANPSKTGINTSDFVLKVDKPAGSQFFAGVQNTFASNFNLTTTNTFKFKIFSTKANVVFRFELAVVPQTDPVTGNPPPVFVTIPNANTWTEVSVVFTGLPGGPTAYNHLVIKPDNTQTDSDITTGGTYYIDDITLNNP